MSLLAFIFSSSVVSFSVIVSFEHLILGLPWDTAVPEALIATALGHLIVLLWLHYLGKG